MFAFNTGILTSVCALMAGIFVSILFTLLALWLNLF